MYSCFRLYKYICYFVTFSPSCNSAGNVTVLVYLVYSIILERGHVLIVLISLPVYAPSVGESYKFLDRRNGSSARHV